MSGCMADYSEEDLKLIKSVRKEMLDEFKKKIDSCVIKHIFQGKNEFLLIDKEELKSKLEGLKN